MSEPRRRDHPSSDPVDGGSAWGPSPWFLAIALCLVAGGLGYGWLSAPPASVADASPAAASVAASGSTSAAPLRVAEAAATASTAARAMPAPPPSTAASAPHILRVRDPNGDQTPDITDFINDGERPTMTEVIARLHQAGVHTGLGAFSPPGTRPLLVGLAVPEGFALPAGYVRHYQATDDGQRVEPILMFSPDTQVLDAAGQPIAIPVNRVVPPELAPPGLPIRRIAIPAPLGPTPPGS
jgi:hypothetical protein